MGCTGTRPRKAAFALLGSGPLGSVVAWALRYGSTWLVVGGVGGEGMRGVGVQGLVYRVVCGLCLGIELFILKLFLVS